MFRNVPECSLFLVLSTPCQGTRFVNIKDGKNVLVTVKPGTSEIFLECYGVARKRPTRREKTKRLAGTLSSL